MGGTAGQKPGLWEESKSGPLLTPFSSREPPLPDPALWPVSLCWVLRKGLSNSDAHRAAGTESEVTTVHAGSRCMGPGPRSGPVGTEGHPCEEGSTVCIQQVLSKGAAYLWLPRGSSRSRFLSHPHEHCEGAGSSRWASGPSPGVTGTL